MVDKYSPLPLYVQVENYLQDKIKQDNLTPGDPVPSENQVSQELGVSRMTARQAINNLVLKGILLRHKGRGTFVNDRNPERIEMPLNKLRGFSQRSSMMGKKPNNKVVCFEICRADNEVAEKLQVSEGEQLYYMERLRCLDDDPVVLEQSYMTLRVLPEINEAVLLGSKYQYLIDKGFQPDCADREYLAEIPSEYVAGLLKLQRNEPVLKAKSTVYLEDQTPFEYSEISYNQKRYRFTLKPEY